MPLPPTSVVPFKKPEHLVGRDEIVASLHKRLKKGNVALTPALTGQGGIGKTQLAALYVHTYPDAFPGGVFWLNCATPTSDAILGQIAEVLAPKLGVESPLQDPEARRRELAAGWLAKVRNRVDILIVADNLEEPRLLESLAGLANSKLTSFGCGLLITSRQRGLPDCEDVEVERLTQPASCALLKQESETNGLDEVEAVAIASVAAMLGGLPPTLRMAGALVREHGASFSDLAMALGQDGVIEILDADGCPLDDYRANVDRALRGLIEECLASVPQHRTDWLETLKAMAMLPENAVVQVNFLRNFCGAWADGSQLRNPYQLALRHLFKHNLVEHPDQDRATLRLHPLIHEHFHRVLDQTFIDGALHRAAEQLLSSDYLASLTSQSAIALGLALESLSEVAGDLGTLQKVITRQAHNLADGLGVLPQLHLQATLDSNNEFAERLDRAAHPPRIRIRWSTATTDPAQLRFLKGHESGVMSCAFSPDGKEHFRPHMMGP